MSDLVVVMHRPSGMLLPPATSMREEERRGLMLLPGENTVSAVYWDAVKSNPGVKIALGAGDLQNKGEGVAKPLVDDWSAITLAKAKELLEQIEDVPKLSDIKKKAKKKGLRDLCAKRIEVILSENETANS